MQISIFLNESDDLHENWSSQEKKSYPFLRKFVCVKYYMVS